MQDKPTLRCSHDEGHICVILTDGSLPFGGGDVDRIETEEGSRWWLARLLVKERVRRQGWGTKIIEEIKKHLNGIPIIVTPGGYDDNDEGREKFYKSVGFKWSQKKDYMIFKNGSDGKG